MSSGVSDKRAATPKPIDGTQGFFRSLASSRASLLERLFTPIDIASLVYFRVAFGALLLWEVWNYYDHGWIETIWVDPVFTFTYLGFGWVHPWPDTGIYLHFLALGVLAVFIMIGLWYRVSAALFFVGFAYVFLMDQAYYVNHFYLICLISFLMIFVPAHRALSVDAGRRPAIRSDTAPAWALWILLAQVGIPYFYGGLSKLNGDWLRGEPMRMWLTDMTDFPVIGHLFTEWWAAYMFAYGGLLFDLSVVPLLLWRRTRPFAFVAAIAFHLTNANLFHIGVFPPFMIAATALFFHPDWPRRLLGLRQPSPKIGLRERRRSSSAPTRPAISPLQSRQRAIVILLAAYLVLQLVVPFRHHLYPGNVSWTEEGHRFSWHMMLREKEAEARFFVTDSRADETWEVDTEDFLTDDQADFMESRPDMILQFAHHLEDEWRQEGYERVEVRADVTASLNGREPQRLVDPSVDLAAQSRTLLPASWIVPLEQPLPARSQTGD